MEKPVYLITIFLCSWLLSPSTNPKNKLFKEIESKVIPLSPLKHPIIREEVIAKVLGSKWSMGYQAMSVDDYYDNGILTESTWAQIRLRKKTMPDFSEKNLLTLKRKPAKYSNESRKLLNDAAWKDLSEDEYKAMCKKVKALFEEEFNNHDPRCVQAAMALEGFYITRSKVKLRDSLIMSDNKWFLEIENYFGSSMPIFLESEWPSLKYINALVETLGLDNSELYSTVSAGSQKIFRILGADGEYLNLDGNRIQDSLIWWKRDDMIRGWLKQIHEWYFQENTSS